MASRSRTLPVVTAAFAVSWDGRMIEQLPPEKPVDAVLLGKDAESKYFQVGASPARIELRGKLPLRKALEHLRARHGVRRVGFAGGPGLFRVLASGGLLDELCLAWRPGIKGGKSASPITGLDEDFLPRGVTLDLLKLKRSGGECRATYRIQPRRA